MFLFWLMICAQQPIIFSISLFELHLPEIINLIWIFWANFIIIFRAALKFYWAWKLILELKKNCYIISFYFQFLFWVFIFSFYLLDQNWINLGPLRLVLSTYLGLVACYKEEVNREAYNSLFFAFGIQFVFSLWKNWLCIYFHFYAITFCFRFNSISFSILI